MADYYIPETEGIANLILTRLEDLLTLKLITEIDEHDLSRISNIKVGPLQEGPDHAVLLIYESQRVDPQDWAHKPLRFSLPRSSRGYTAVPGLETEQYVRVTAGRETIGGGTMIGMSFSIQFAVWGNNAPEVEVTRRDVGKLNSIIQSRIMRVLVDGGHLIGGSSIIQDDFGLRVSTGPHWGDSWLVRAENEGLRTQSQIQFWYRVFMDGPS